MKRSLFSRTLVIALVPAAFVGLASCGPESADVTDEVLDVAGASQELALWRGDQNGFINPGEGPWGSWTQLVFCNPGMYAVGYKIRLESGQGSGDDTALNSVQLFCSNPNTGAGEWLSSYDGIWGNWGSPASCPGSRNFLNGARIRIEGSQGGGDDTSANDVNFTCSGGGYIATQGGAWGSWSNWSQCPNNTAVCGLSIKFEGSQGRGDDTAMNGLQLACCSL